MLSLIVLDIDECVHDNNTCDVNAICNNTIGSYTCECLGGFFGDGLTCTGKNSFHDRK